MKPDLLADLNFRALLKESGLPILRDEPPALFGHFPQALALGDGTFAPIPAGAAEEVETSVGSLTFTWAAVTTTPSLQRLQLVGKTLLRQLVLRLSGTWDQSGGAESQATEGNPVLIQEVRLNCDGRVIRAKPGAVLYEENRLMFRGAGPKTDPSTGNGTSKAFSCTLFFDMGFLDLDHADGRETPYLDLSQFANVFLEVQMAAFNAYCSGNTQANMTATMAVSTLEIIGPRRLPQLHYEMLLVQSVDMTTTGTSRKVPLPRTNLVLRGLLLRVGTLAATPRVTAITALTNVGVQGKLNAGALVVPKEKQAVALYQNQVGAFRSGISLTAGYLWIDFASNRKPEGLIRGNAYSGLDLVFDSTGTTSTTMEVYAACLTR
jgi:hypothetical protein